MAESIALTDSFTFFLYDFKLNKPFRSYEVFSEGSRGVWKRSSVQPDESYLFPHVRDFFTKNIGLAEPDENQFVIYELKRDHVSPEDKVKLSLFNNLFSKPHFLAQAGKDKENLHFNMMADVSVLSPKIFICPLTSIGLFTFCFKLADAQNTLENLLNFNFKARTISLGQEILFGTPGSTHEQAMAREIKTNEDLAQFTKSKPKTHFTESGVHYWTLRTFVNYFLQDLDADSYKEISPSRIQAFTYAQTERKLPKEELRHAIFRLRRMYNYNYLPPEIQSFEDQECFQPFEQIHFGASVEGVAVLLNADKSELPEFLRNYNGVLKQRSIWTYILSYHQRLALIVSATEVADLYERNQSPSMQQLSVIVKKITRVQLKCMFNEISHFTQQNDFYYLCCRNLRLPSLFLEIKEELTELNNTLAEEWHKEEESARRLNAEQEKKRERNFSTLIGMLMVPQIWFAMIIIELDRWHEFLVEYETEVYWVTGLMWLAIFAAGIKIYWFDKEKSKKTRKSLVKIRADHKV